MRAHYLQHVPFENLGYIEAWLKKKNYKVTSTQFFKNHSLPDPQSVDLLIIMGGPMSVNDEAHYPWLFTEIQFVKQVIELGKKVIGVCLGAQIIAKAMGSNIYKNTEKEIGWFPIQKVVSPNPTIFQFPPLMNVFHWHGETFDLPKKAILLAQSDACKNQAFQIGQSVIGLQFHLEMTPQLAQNIIVNCRNELRPSKYIQSETSILAVKPKIYKSTNKVMDNILSYLNLSSI